MLIVEFLGYLTIDHVSFGRPGISFFDCLVNSMSQTSCIVEHVEHDDKYCSFTAKKIKMNIKCIWFCGPFNFFLLLSI